MSDVKNKSTSKSQLIPINTSTKTKNTNLPKINFSASSVKLTPSTNSKSSIVKINSNSEMKTIYPPSPSPEYKPILTNSLTTLNKLNDTSNSKPVKSTSNAKSQKTDKIDSINIINEMPKDTSNSVRTTQPKHHQQT